MEQNKRRRRRAGSREHSIAEWGTGAVLERQSEGRAAACVSALSIVACVASASADYCGRTRGSPRCCSETSSVAPASDPAHSPDPRWNSSLQTTLPTTSGIVPGAATQRAPFCPLAVCLLLVPVRQAEFRVTWLLPCSTHIRTSDSPHHEQY
ncbi:hypothetical protein Aduo_012134 [Ancylostoma duodenale]